MHPHSHIAATLTCTTFTHSYTQYTTDTRPARSWSRGTGCLLEHYYRYDRHEHPQHHSLSTPGLCIIARKMAHSCHQLLLDKWPRISYPSNSPGHVILKLPCPSYPLNKLCWQSYPLNNFFLPKVPLLPCPSYM